jgi:HK97 family phage portal protein
MLGRIAQRRFSAPSQPEARSWAMSQLAFMPSGSIAYTTGRYVSTDNALRTAAVWACVDVLSSSVSTLPVDAVRYVGSTRQQVTPTPSLLTSPSALVDLDVWLYQLVWSMLVDGNAFGLVSATDRSGYPTTIEWLSPSDVTERKVAEGRASVMVRDVGRRDVWPFGEVFHIPGKMVQPGSPFGMSTVAYAAGPIDTSLQAEAYGGRFFADGGHPSALLRSSEDLTADQAAAIKAAWLNATSGSREPAVLDDRIEYEAIQVDPEQAQPIDLLRFEVEQICRFFRVPPSMVYGSVSGQSVTYANVSQADLHYLKHSLDGYLVRIERALTAALPRPQVVKFNRDALLRADTLTRYQAHQIALGSKFATVNEVRALEDMPPLDGGDDIAEDTPGPSEETPDDPSD